MTEQTLSQLFAVLVGGVVAIASGFFTTLLVENRRQTRESRNLALAFRGEISALLEHIHERRYLKRFQEIITQIESTGEPFYVPMRVRFRYDRVYDANVERIGVLVGPLPEMVPQFYTRLNSILEDLVSLGEGTYRTLDLPTLLRVYCDLHHLLNATVLQGEQIIAEIDRHYKPGR
jgi:hypothetical protein